MEIKEQPTSLKQLAIRRWNEQRKRKYEEMRTDILIIHGHKTGPTLYLVPIKDNITTDIQKALDLWSELNNDNITMPVNNSSQEPPLKRTRAKTRALPDVPPDSQSETRAVLSLWAYDVLLVWIGVHLKDFIVNPAMMLAKSCNIRKIYTINDNK
jgi:hypothetical protein